MQLAKIPHTHKTTPRATSAPGADKPARHPPRAQQPSAHTTRKIPHIETLWLSMRRQTAEVTHTQETQAHQHRPTTLQEPQTATPNQAAVHVSDQGATQRPIRLNQGATQRPEAPRCRQRACQQRGVVGGRAAATEHRPLHGERHFVRANLHAFCRAAGKNPTRGAAVPHTIEA